ncbi:HEAT repeat domain-containing protein [Gemmatimonadota bacterium]
MLELYERDVAGRAEVLGSRDSFTRQNARERLVELGSAAVPLLRRLLEADRNRVRLEAALGLRDLANPSSTHALLQALEDEDGDVRWVAAEALAAIGEPGLEPLLAALIIRADSLELREGARLVISYLDDWDLRMAMDPVREALGRRSSPEVVTQVASLVLRRWPPSKRSRAVG